MGSGLAKIAVCVGLALAIAAVLVFGRTLFTDEKVEAKADAAASAEDVAGARTTIEDRFPNAQSIVFGKAFVHGEGAARAVCGLVDIDQPDDSFEGQERFVFLEGALTLEETEGSDAVDQKWKDVCEG